MQVYTQFGVAKTEQSLSKILDLKIEYPHGAGGSFIAAVLFCCITDTEWISGLRTNFHPDKKIQSNHLYDLSDTVLKVDSPLARYNFWIYYWKKRVLFELKYYRKGVNRWIKCPYQDFGSKWKSDGFWVLNQCRFIQDYCQNQTWRLDWLDIVNLRPEPWQIIDRWLQYHGAKNFWTFEQWCLAVKDYTVTLPKVKINTNHISWKIWCVAYLQNQGIYPDFDLHENFYSERFNRWLESYNNSIVEHTKTIMTELVDQK